MLEPFIVYNLIVTRNQKGVVFLPTLVIVLVLGVVGYFVYQSIQSRQNTFPVEEINVNWETYTDSNRGFILKYPKQLGNYSGLYIESVLDEQREIHLLGTADDYSEILMSFGYIDSSNTTFDELIKTQMSGFDVTEEVVVGGKKAIKFTFTEGPYTIFNVLFSAGHQEVIVFLRKGGFFYIRHSLLESVNPERAKYKNQILSTFKFIDVPSGNSSNIIDVKFSNDAEVSKPENLLPSSLITSVSSIKPLISLSDGRLQNINASEMKLWMRIILKPNTDSEIFLKNLLSLPSVETAEFTSLPAPPP